MRLLRSAIMALPVAAVLASNAGLVKAQDFPARTIRIITSPAGGASDFASRFIAQGISAPLGQQVVVDNRTAILIPAAVLSEKPDGHTLMMLGLSLWVRPLLTKLPYDAVRDFAPITWVSRETNVIFVHPSLPLKSIKELVSLARARPGEINFASSGIGSGSHLALELFKSLTGTNIVAIQYKGSAQGVSAVAAGESQMAMFDLGTSVPMMKSGRIRGLAVTSTTPSVLLPELPTVSASGVPGFEAVGVTALWAPAKTPATAIQRLNQEIVRFLNTQEARQRLLGMMTEVVASSPEQFDAYIKADIARLSKVIREANIRLD